MLELYKRWKKHNEIQLTKNKMDMNNRKKQIIHPLLSEESHPVTDPLGKDSIGETVDDQLSLPNLNTIIINKTK